MDEHNKTGLPNQPKKGPGNPNFKKGVKNPHHNKYKKPEVNNNTDTNETHQNFRKAMADTVIKPDIDIESETIPKSQDHPLDVPKVKADYTAINEEGTTNANTENTNAQANSEGAGPSAQTTPETNTTPKQEAQNLGQDNNGGGGPATDLGNGQATQGQDEKSPEEIRINAEGGVNLFIRGYKGLHRIARAMCKVNLEELSLEHKKGKIDLNTTLPVGKKIVTAGEFAEVYNNTIDTQIVVTEEFERDIRPPLTRIFIKYKVNLGGDIGDVAGILIEDGAVKIGILTGLKKTMSGILDFLHKQATQNQNGVVENNNNNQNNNPENTNQPTWKEPGAGGIQEAEIVG